MPASKGLEDILTRSAGNLTEIADRTEGEVLERPLAGPITFFSGACYKKASMFWLKPV